MALLQRFSFILLFATLIGCGGSSGGFDETPDGGEGSTPDAITISLVISDENLTNGSATLTATVSQGAATLPNQVVTFTTTLGAFNPESGTALTANGIAEIGLVGGDVAGAGTVTATIATGEFATVDFTTIGSSPVVVRIGSGTPFVEGVADVRMPTISAGGTTVISVSLVDDADALYTESVDVTFASECAKESTAQIDETVTTSSGLANATYLAKGCVGNDPITVSALVNGKPINASAVVNVLPADVGSIEFISATPSTIGIIGTGAVGGSEESTIVFRVLDRNGNPVKDRDVEFSLSTSTGGILIDPLTASTNAEGIVQTVVNSGSVATTVRVNAVVIDSSPVISTQSSVLVISTGIPDQDSMSISFSKLNPDAWEVDNVGVDVVVLLADAFNNPVPDGTAVSFTTEGGSIESSCITVDGGCTVKWRSQFPRPEGQKLAANNVPPRISNIDAAGVPNFMGQKYGGRVSIIATAIGEESFPDLNGNGRFDVCEVPAFTGGVGKPCNADGSFNNSGADITYTGLDVSGRPYDLAEAYADYNEDGFFNPAEENANEQAGGELEEYVEFNGDGTFNSKDGLYNGVLCAIPEHAGCSVTQKSINVRAQGTIVMSGAVPFWCLEYAADVINNTKSSVIANNPLRFCVDRPAGTNAAGQALQDQDYDNHLVVSPKSSASFSIVLADLHNQGLPTGTSVSFNSSIGSITSGPSDVSGSAHNGGEVFGGTFKAGEELESGNIDMVITYEGGSTYTQTILNVYVE